jgi:hypothetical protein
VRKIKGGTEKFKEREDSDDKEKYFSINMENKNLNEINEDDQK